MLNFAAPKKKEKIAESLGFCVTILEQDGYLKEKLNK